MVTKILILVLITETLACGQSKVMFDVEEPSYKGFIVKKDVNIFVDDKQEWFQPTISDIKTAEKLIEEHIGSLNSKKVNQKGKECPDIEKNLSKYLRQYIGYINSSGEKIILINMLWKDYDNYNGLDSEYVLILDGCSQYWKVKVNLKSNKLYDLEINGSA